MPEHPKTRTTDAADVLHGVRVPDPYRWLEALDDAETVAWVGAQNAYTRAVIDAVGERDALRARLAALSAYDVWTLPVRRGSRFFALRRTPGQDRPVLVRAEGRGAEPVVLVDPNDWPADRSLPAFVPNDDGTLVAYSIARGGSDWNEWVIVDATTGAIVEDGIRWTRYSSPTWAPDDRSFYWCRYDQFERGARPRVCLHHVGGSDEVVYERPDEPDWRFQTALTQDGRWLLVYTYREFNGTAAVTCMEVSSGRRVELPRPFEARLLYIGNEGSTVFFFTTMDAPNGRLLGIDLSEATPEWREVIPESADALRLVAFKGDCFVAEYLRDARTAIVRVGLDGTPRDELDVPDNEWAGGFGGRSDDRQPAFMRMSFTRPPSMYLYDLETDRTTPFAIPSVPLDSDAIAVRRVAVPRDGVEVPMWIVHGRDGSSGPALLYGYGGFGIPTPPWYWPLALTWVERGGVFAVAGIRGGGEYGEAWHLAGSHRNKQTSFDDFIASAEWLIANGYATPETLAITGASNGGLLVGSCITQRPDLFAAAHIDMGLLDMIGFERLTVGWSAASEYGLPSNPDDFPVLLGYSPLHSVREGVRYPATILTTGDHDELVTPAMSYKFAATLQAANAGDSPIVLRVNTDTGHGGVKPASKTLEESADVLAFLLRAAGGA